MAHILFITGTDTNVGKTVLSVLLTRELLRRGVDVRAVKPLCSGGREDAEALLEAQGRAGFQPAPARVSSIAGTIGRPLERGRLEARPTLDQVNPWHFEEPLTPLVASRRAGKPLHRKEVVAFLRKSAAGCDTLLVEGAGGLLSPLGEDFDARDLIVALKATPLVVAQNRLGAINQSLLVLDALPGSIRPKAHLVVMQPELPDVVSGTNVDVLRERLGSARVHLMPHLPAEHLQKLTAFRLPASLRASLQRLAKSVCA